VIGPGVFLSEGRRRGFDLYAGVPCTLLGGLISAAAEDSRIRYVGAANEGEAVAIASGAALGTSRAAAVMQNSGLGNAVNPLTSLNHVFKIPVLLVIGWRGRPGQTDEPQHALMGEITPALLDRMGIGWEMLPEDAAGLAAAWDRAVEFMKQKGLPYAFLAGKKTFAPYVSGSGDTQVSSGKRPLEGEFRRMDRGERSYRRQIIEELLRRTDPAGSLVVATTGYASRELFAVNDRPNHFYMVGSMGCASSLALGLGFRVRGKRIIVLDGDGALLMRLGSLAANAVYAPPGFVHIVLDNGCHESTGAQPTLSGRVSLGRAALACGYRKVWEGDDPAILEHCLNGGREEGPVFACLKIRPGVPDRLPRPTVSPEEVARRFSRLAGQIGASAGAPV